MSEPTQIQAELQQRGSGQCEICNAQPGTDVFQVEPISEVSAERCAWLCVACATHVQGGELQARDWFCLQDSIWSEVPAVQVLTWRLLHRLGSESWAQDLLEQVYMEDDLMAWAKADLTASAGSEAGSPSAITKDSNGTELSEGDAVTLIKALEVKGGGFTAKRGTLVKAIRLTDDPANVEGRVNGMVLVLKTCFLKKA